jgi:hypothetical protein
MSTIKALVPKTIEEAWTQAKYYYSISFVQANFSSVGDVFFVINLGLELGLSPAQSIQNITILKGRPTIWGDLMPALVQGSGLLENLTETIEGSLENGDAKAVCSVKRKGSDEVVFEFSTEDAKRAGLWKYGTKNEKLKKLPWAAYPLRMLKMRARTFALRDVFADLLKGLTSREEVEDYADIQPPAISPKEEKEAKKEEKATHATKTENIEQSMVKAIPPEPSKGEGTTGFIKLDSALVGESYLVNALDNTLHFESGVVYTEDEINKAKRMTNSEKKKYHLEKVEAEYGNDNLYKKAQQTNDLIEG